MEYNHSNLFNNSMNTSSNISSSPSSIILACNGIVMNRYEMTDSMAATAIFSIITNIILSIASIIGNGLTIYAIAFRLGFTSFAFRGIFMISVFATFHSIVTQVLINIIRFHDLFNFYNCHINIAASAFGFACQCGLYTTITALAIDRYIAVVNHQYYSVMKVHYIYVTLSIITVIIWVPLLTISFLNIMPPKLFKILVSSYLFMHFIIISFAYVNVMLQLAKHSKNRVKKLGASMQEEELEKQRRMEERRQNSVLFIIGTHGATMVVKAVFFAIRVGFPANYELDYYCRRSSQFLIILNAALYPILYAWRIDTLRKEMAKIVKGKLCFSSTTEIEPKT